MLPFHALYLHIPFCHRICNYCDFYVTTARKHFAAYATAVETELDLTTIQPVLKPARTLYAGGGTPSFLPAAHWESIMEKVRGLCDASEMTEVTIEVNPSDVNWESARLWRRLGFNRLSMGVQSFLDSELSFLTRNHDAAQAVRAYDITREAGFTNVNIDLIFGLPGQTVENWKLSLDQAVRLQPEHVSVYNLTVEERTHLHKLVDQGKVALPDDDLQLSLFLTAIEKLGKAGYAHYEISNYAIPGFEAQHNSVYWNRQAYLGIGPSAHSYDGTSRWWNVRNLPDYIERLGSARTAVETREVLSLEQLMIEGLLLGLRQTRGLDITEYESQFNIHFDSQFATGLEKSRDWFTVKEDRMRLTREGLFLYNAVCQSLTDCISP